jgi:hypothetical protein
MINYEYISTIENAENYYKVCNLRLIIINIL